MKVVVSFYGMCLCVLDQRKANSAAGATVLLLNGAAPADVGGAPRLPYHHPLVFVPIRHADLTRTTWSPVPSPDTLVDTEGLVSGKSFAWSLSGLDLAVGRGAGITLFENQTAGPDGLLPAPASPAGAASWADWRRIPDLRRMAPGATLKREYRRIGPQVLGMVRIAAGELRGGPRRHPGGGAAPWRFSSAYAQVITDRFEFHCAVPSGVLKATSYAGGRPQVLALKGRAGDTVRLTVIHEASVADLAMQRAVRATAPGRRATGSELPHYTAFYAALQGKGVQALEVPRQVAAPDPRAVLPVIDTPDCPPALF